MTAPDREGRGSRGVRWGRVALLAGLLAAALAGGCRPADQETGALDPRGEQTRTGLAPELVAALDSGSRAFRAGDLDAALEQYGRAAELDPDHAAGWFGMYMVHHRRGATDAAAAALERAQRAAPGASIIHPTAADTIR
ncbi:MAG: tetratricopeptide repeat protein [Longimicrobiales bacterium]